jgi:4-diphosphocytidyl-2-C-methyl-D-erythritol kinase
MTLLAPAKVNLTLRILGRRPDGYHDLESLVQKVSLYDRLTFSDADDGVIELTCDDPTLPTDSGNLVWRAADLLRERFAPPGRGVRIRLEKRIPHGAGLGGGSSDAATTLLGLNSLWDLKLSREVLSDLGARLGSDIPLFLHPSPSVMTGRGEIVDPALLWIKAVFVIVYPGISISTQWVYSNFRLTKDTNNLSILALQKAEGGELPPDRWNGFLINDLEGSVLKEYPEVARCRDELLQWGAVGALMSGSGSAVFGLFEDREKAEKAALSLSEGERRRVEVALPVFS